MTTQTTQMTTQTTQMTTQTTQMTTQTTQMTTQTTTQKNQKMFMRKLHLLKRMKKSSDNAHRLRARKHQKDLTILIIPPAIVGVLAARHLDCLIVGLHWIWYVNTMDHSHVRGGQVRVEARIERIRRATVQLHECLKPVRVDPHVGKCVICEFSSVKECWPMRLFLHDVHVDVPISQQAAKRRRLI